LATPEIVDESIRITRASLGRYRSMRAKGLVPDMTRNALLESRSRELASDARTTLAAIESSIPDPYSPEGLYLAFWAGFLPVPDLWECRDEFQHAVRCRTRVIDGSVRLVDESGRPTPRSERLREACENARSGRLHELSSAGGRG
jgi:hypothetical protein